VVTELEKAGEDARHALVGKLYTQELLTKVENALKTFRAAKKS
jgi:hypothetical protein